MFGCSKWGLGVLLLMGSCCWAARREDGSSTYQSTRSKLQEFAKLYSPQPVGRQIDASAVPLRTGFYKALGDIEKSIKLAHANVKNTNKATAQRTLSKLRSAIVSAAKSGNYRTGREIFGHARFLEDKASLSRSRRRHKRSSEAFLNYLRDRIDEQTFNQFFSIESGTSLTFVLDTTGSMKEDIHQVLNIVRELATPEENQEDPGSGYSNFLIAPFKDPEYGPAESFYDKAEFLSALEGITVSGGGDCDELVLKGMIEGLELTEAYSPVYVFTDAGTKDQYEYDNVVSLSQNLYAPTFFFLTPSVECSKDISTYESMAEDTGGQVLSLTKEEIGSMQNLIKSAGVGTSEVTSGSERRGRSAAVTRDKRSTGETHVITFECDDTVTKLLVTVSFRTPTGSSYLLSPNNALVYPTFVSAATNMRLYELREPQYGTWTLKAIADQGDQFTYKVSSVSSTNIDFAFYFVKSYRGREVPTDNTIPGEVMKLKINILGEENSIRPNSSQVYLMDTDGNVISTIQTLNLASNADVGFQYDGVFIVPKQTFKLMLYGETKEGYPFTRTSQGIVTPSYATINPLGKVVSKRLVKPGSRGSFFFKFEHYSDNTSDFILSFTNPFNIIRSTGPIQLNGIRKGRSKLVKLPYVIARETPEGTELRITLRASGGEIKVSYVYPVLITRFA